VPSGMLQESLSPSTAPWQAPDPIDVSIFTERVPLLVSSIKVPVCGDEVSGLHVISQWPSILTIFSLLMVAILRALQSSGCHADSQCVSIMLAPLRTHFSSISHCREDWFT